MTDEWQDIATAPRDGATVLLWCVVESGGWAQTGYFEHNESYAGWLDSYEGVGLADPTHWRPLPEPPK